MEGMRNDGGRLKEKSAESLKKEGAKNDGGGLNGKDVESLRKQRDEALKEFDEGNEFLVNNTNIDSPEKIWKIVKIVPREDGTRLLTLKTLGTLAYEANPEGKEPPGDDIIQTTDEGLMDRLQSPGEGELSPWMRLRKNS